MISLTPRDTLDFRTGRNGWGHALHASTWSTIGRPPRPWWDLLSRHRDRRDNVRRHTFMVHTQGEVREGMRVLWTTGSGDAVGTITEVKPCWDPRDMYTLEVEVRGSGLWTEPPPEHVNCRCVVETGDD